MSEARRPVRENIDPDGSNNRTDEERAEFVPVVLALITQGLNDTEISKRVGIDRRAVAYWRKKSSGVAIKGPTGVVQRGVENDRVQFEILRLHYQGLTYVQIAEEVGLSWETVRSRLRKEFSKALETEREHVAGRAVADMEIMRLELLDIIIRDDTDIEITVDEIETALQEGAYNSIIKKVSDKNKAALEAKFKAMEIMLKLLDREAKQFGTDAASNVNINHTVKADPNAIELLNRLKGREIDNVQDAEVIEGDWDMGNM